MTIVSELIRAEIATKGPISFARFMELALYCPGSGYYEAEKDTVGRRGDFYTSVSTGPVFGQLLAFQFTHWLQELSRTGRYQLVEAGAHHGALASDILGWLGKVRPDVLPCLEYWIVEPSPVRQAKQRERLAPFGNNVHFAAKLADIPGGVTGVIFSNELLDAMPVHRLTWDANAHSWYEWGVGQDGDKFVWVRLEQGVEVPGVPSGLLAVLPDGYTHERSPAALQWWQDAAAVLQRGKLLTFDYGMPETFMPTYIQGTLRAYHRHHLAEDILANPGAQDLTAHVDFSAVQKAGELAGLRTELFQTQAAFLTDIVQRLWAQRNIVAEWTLKQTRQFQTLTHPQHLGRAFHVLVQAR